jgi:hypothetical protein
MAGLLLAIRGPVLLISLGVLLLIQRFADAAFSKTWPVLLIVFGVMKLAERTAARQAPQPLDGPWSGTTGGPTQ